MKKVLFTIASLYDGGAERALSNIVTHFPEDWEIDILLNNERMIEYPYKGNILSLSLPDFRNRKTLFYFLKELIRRTSYLRKIKKTNHCQFPGQFQYCECAFGKALLQDDRVYAVEYDIEKVRIDVSCQCVSADQVCVWSC